MVEREINSHLTSDDSEESTHLIRNDRPHGLTLTQTVMMIAGTLAGSGILALPSAIESTGWIGVLLIVYLGCLSGYTGAVLGWSWTIIERRYVGILNIHTQDPYPLIGEKAMGRSGRILVKICIYVVSFGGGTVFLLLAADIVSDLIRTLAKMEFSLCYIALIIGGILIPMNWFGTPVDFWPMGVIALLSTTVACFMVNGYTIHLTYAKTFQVKHQPVEASKFFMALGSIAFTLAGHPGFPTIQQDMRERRKFGLAVAIAFAIVILLYLLITLPSYYLLGDKIGANILTTLASIQPGWPVIVAEFLLLTHLITAYLIVLNPVMQDLEEVFKVPNKFSVKRVAIRTIVMVSIIFVAESIPRFSVLLSLVGGSAITMIIYILPVIMYELLSRQDGGDWKPVTVPWYITTLNVEIVLIGVLLLVTSTYFAILEIFGPNTFVPPCYVNISAVHI